MPHAPLTLGSGSKVAVVGGGPAASFFAITLMREAAALGRNLELRIFERRGGILAPDGRDYVPTTGCNYCAGGVSPRMSDVLDELGIEVPPEIVQDRIRTVTVQSHWKNLELRVPEDRRMYSVYRGARPLARAFRILSFDSLLLSKAAEAGSVVVNGEVTGISRSSRGRPRIVFRRPGGGPETFTADFAVFAGGVNRTPGASLGRSGLVKDLARAIPGFTPPAVRPTLIVELRVTEELAQSLAGDLTFVLFGSPKLRIEMGSIMPKGRFVTVVLIGPDVDRIPAPRVLRAFLDLPHIARIFPPGQVLETTSCVCRPSMVVGCAKNPVADRLGVVGDMVTARLYKDGIYTAYLTGAGLARAALSRGIDAGSLSETYLPLIRRLEHDLRAGRRVFASVSLAFGNPLLSRMAYQAVLRERRLLPEGRRRLERVLWLVASGDAPYTRILRAMLDPRAICSLIVRGALITVRNFATELLFGLRWDRIGRFPTGVSREDRIAAVRRIGGELDLDLRAFRDFHRMYTIRIRAPATRIERELGRLGDPERPFLKPRFVEIRRIRGRPNEVGSVIEYSVWPEPLSLRLVLERRVAGRSLVYRVTDGFAKGGVLVFTIRESAPRDCRLSILVAFDFYRGPGIRKRLVWWLYRHLFPRFIHDVLWNHALCQLKGVAERPAVAGPLNPSWTRRTETSCRIAGEAGRAR